MPPHDIQPETGLIEQGAHWLPVRIYYEDTDFSGIVYHANYLKYFERGRSNFLRCLGLRHTDLLEAESPTVFAVNRLTLDFHKPARIDDALLVETRFAGWTGARLHVAQALRRQTELLVSAELEVCCISLTGRPKKPPSLLIERLKPLLDQTASTF